MSRPSPPPVPSTQDGAMSIPRYALQALGARVTALADKHPLHPGR